MCGSPSLLHHLQYLAGLEGGAGQQYDGRGDAACLHAHHVRELVVAEVRDLFRVLRPWVPDHSIREVVLLYPHLASADDVGDDVLLHRVLVDPVRPLVDGHHLARLLVHGAFPSLINEHAAVHAGDLTAPDVGHLEVGVQQHLAAERQLLAGVVHADVEVQLLLAQDQSVRQSELEMPHGPGEVIIHEAEDSFDIAAGQSLRHFFHVPASYPGEPVLRTERPLSELREYKRYPSSYRPLAIEHCLFTYK